MACQLKKGLPIQSIVRGLNRLNITARKNAHTMASATNSVKKLPRYLTVREATSSDSCLRIKFDSTPPVSTKMCCAFNVIEITDRLKPTVVIEAPKSSDIDNSISNPLSTLVKPIKAPKTNSTTIKPPSVDTPKSASKNGNMYVLRLKKRKRKLRQLEKVQAKVWPIKKKIVFLRNQRKERKIKEKCDMYNSWAEEYDVMEEIKRNLEEAKKQGYKYDMFGPGAETFGFGVQKQEVKSLGDHLKMMKEKKKA